MLLKKQLSLPAKLKRSVRQRRSSRSNKKAKNSALPLEAVQKVDEERLHALPFSAECPILVGSCSSFNSSISEVILVEAIGQVEGAEATMRRY